MKAKSIAAVGALMILGGNAAFAQWSPWSSENPMGDSVRKGIASTPTPPMKSYRFPHHKLEGFVGLSCREPGVYLGFDPSPNLNNTTTRDGYDTMRLRVRFDGQPAYSARFVQAWGSAQIQTRSPRVREDVLKYSTMTIELPWHSLGNVYFRLSLAGGSALYKQQCAESIAREQDQTRGIIVGMILAYEGPEDQPDSTAISACRSMVAKSVMAKRINTYAEAVDKVDKCLAEN